MTFVMLVRSPNHLHVDGQEENLELSDQQSDVDSIVSESVVDAVLVSDLSLLRASYDSGRSERFQKGSIIGPGTIQVLRWSAARVVVGVARVT